MDSPSKAVITPKKEQPGISKTVHTHISTIRSLLDNWRLMREKGLKLCKAILALKLYECADGYFPNKLQPLTASLVEVKESLHHIVEGVSMINNHLKAVALLQPTESPVVSTWSASKILDTVNKIYLSLQKEYSLKEVVTENIGHCREKPLIEVYVCAWEFDVYVDLESAEYLFAEFDISPISL